MYAVLMNKDHDLVLCLILPEKKVCSAAKARTTRELTKLGYKPAIDTLMGEKWTYSRIKPHWVLRGKPCRQFIYDGDFYTVYLVDGFYSCEINPLIKDNEQVIIVK